MALVGAGRHGLRYAHHIVHDFPELSLVGLWRRNRTQAEEAASQLGCRAFDDYRELIAAPGVDVVVVAVPPALHPDIIEHAAHNRRAVMLEKPAAINLDAVGRIYRSVQAAGIPVMVTQTLRFNQVVKTFKQAIERIAPIHALRISQRFEPSRPGWVDQPELSGGGVMMLTGVHSFDMVRHLSGLEVDSCQCEISRSGTTTRTEDNFSAVLRMRGSQVLAAVSGSRATASRSGPIEIAGERGQLIGDHALNQAWIVEGTTATPLDVGAPLPTVRETIAAFIAALDAGGPMPVTLEDGLRAAAIARTCYEAAERGCRVDVPRLDFDR